jgi:hypothetical protein
MFCDCRQGCSRAGAVRSGAPALVFLAGMRVLLLISNSGGALEHYHSATYPFIVVNGQCKTLINCDDT